jgi:hypothetical protein
MPLAKPVRGPGTDVHGGGASILAAHTSETAVEGVATDTTVQARQPRSTGRCCPQEFPKCSSRELM